MDRTSLIGLILGIIAVGVGMVFKGVSPSVLINPAAILIILLGTAAAVTIRLSNERNFESAKVIRGHF
ncbi:MAG: hypothetical protein KatS3mg080_0631 [Anoxybacillus sp.]|nr:MAG: hypothetical protein KatS3mg080_0631 [Anoxybacillus sp.]